MVCTAVAAVTFDAALRRTPSSVRSLDALTASNQLLSCLLSSPAALRLVIVINSTATAPHGNLPRRTRQYSRNDLSHGSFVKAFRHTHELRSDRLLLLRMFSFLLIEWVRARVRCRINLTLTSTNPQKVSKLDGGARWSSLSVAPSTY